MLDLEYKAMIVTQRVCEKKNFNETRSIEKKET